ncbi:hypothetical protein MBAV_002641 [Candidatus Magnetobacterium bavaricum]|uniref:Uncharacterized protein n=1 Tax=Candidatus Magnetobacterium bavaricum TaxID=29290 RepID=A0A0F3GTH7_9BACT|nr:hypothetical protein MBAV_002641 [Candidatus Magnetobacterium bavaricum]
MFGTNTDGYSRKAHSHNHIVEPGKQPKHLGHIVLCLTAEYLGKHLCLKHKDKEVERPHKQHYRRTYPLKAKEFLVFLCHHQKQHPSCADKKDTYLCYLCKPMLHSLEKHHLLKRVFHPHYHRKDDYCNKHHTTDPNNNTNDVYRRQQSNCHCNLLCLYLFFVNLPTTIIHDN